MSQGRHAFKETTITRAIRAAKKAGLTNFIVRAGPVEIQCNSEAPSQEPPATEGDEWKVA
jgi:hypothetical protein